AVGLRRVGGGEHERLRLVVLPRSQLPQPLDGSAEGELRSTQPLHEVAAPAGAERLERAQLAVHGAVAAWNPLGPDGVAGDDAVPLEQELCERAAVGLGTGEELRRERPASLRRRRPVRAGAAEGRPSSGASSRKKTATRSSPAPTHTSSPEAQSWSSCSGR